MWSTDARLTQNTLLTIYIRNIRSVDAFVRRRCCCITKVSHFYKRQEGHCFYLYDGKIINICIHDVRRNTSEFAARFISGTIYLCGAGPPRPNKSTAKYNAKHTNVCIVELINVFYNMYATFHQHVASVCRKVRLLHMPPRRELAVVRKAFFGECARELFSLLS